jgi:hypothetical protein
MAGHLDGIYVKDGILILDRRLAETKRAEPVMGGAYSAVIQAQREEAAKEEKHRRETGDVSPIRDAIDRIKSAMQEALTKYLAENSNA